MQEFATWYPAIDTAGYRTPLPPTSDEEPTHRSLHLENMSPGANKIALLSLQHGSLSEIYCATCPIYTRCHHGLWQTIMQLTSQVFLTSIHELVARLCSPITVCVRFDDFILHIVTWLGNGQYGQSQLTTGRISLRHFKLCFQSRYVALESRTQTNLNPSLP